MSNGTDRTPSSKVDVCVVGSGVAGAVVASKLAQRGHEVVVLEAGKRFPPPGQRYDQMERALRPSHPQSEVWDMGGERDRYTTSGEIAYPLNQLRVKGVGGTTLHWGGYSPRFHQKDFEMESRYGLAADWPISYADLQPYYLAAERELGVAGADDSPFAPREAPYPLSAFPPSQTDAAFAEACERLKIPLHTMPQARNSSGYDGRPMCLGFGTCSPVCPIGAKYSGDVHVREGESHGVRVIDRAPVQRLEHGDDPSSVAAAVYATPDGRYHRQEARQFVLACGAVENARLLLLSTSEAYPDGLANSSGVVGKYFMDHPYVGVAAWVEGAENPDPLGYTTSISHQFYEPDEETGGSFMLTFPNKPPAELTHPALKGGDQRASQETLDPLLGDQWGDELLATMRERELDDGTELSVVAAVEQLPREENRVTLDESKTDDFGNPVPDVSWNLGAYELETMEAAQDIQREILEEMGGTVTWASGGQPHAAGHHMGTTRMGTDPTESVVDPRLRTHDLTNLSIVSSSVFVTGAAVNPTLTIVALALRAVEHLDTDLRASR
jgi:choline dehydrogenase-like flavoprotein